MPSDHGATYFASSTHGDREALARAALTIAASSRDCAVACALAAASPPSRVELTARASTLRTTAVSGVRLARRLVREHADGGGVDSRSYATVCDARRAIGRVLGVAHRIERACAFVADTEHVRVRARAALALADAAADLAGAALRLQSALGVRDAVIARAS